MFKVCATGPQATFQDLGRIGFMSSGVSPSGAFDRRSAARANFALGNQSNAPVVEILYGGFSVTALTATTVVFTGCESEIILDFPDGHRKMRYTNTIIDVPSGTRLTLCPADVGLRAYFSTRGGFDVTEILHSVATDTLSHIGPDLICTGDVLITRVETASSWLPTLRQLPPLRSHSQITNLNVIAGPRQDWFTAESIEHFYSDTFSVSTDSNRIGVRLHASFPMQRAFAGELASEGMVRGSIQVPPSGHPVMFGPDHPVTGGYPVVAVLTSDSCDRAAQLAPGDKIRFQRLY